MIEPSRTLLLLSLQQALLGNVGVALRQASIEANPLTKVVTFRFEYEPVGMEAAQELCSAAAAEVVADLPPDWNIDEQHVPVPESEYLRALTLVAFRRSQA
jgi:hypothetical protein